MKYRMMSNGHLWCVACGKPWKECPCPGDVQFEVMITKEMIDATLPNPEAWRAGGKSSEYEELIREAIAQKGSKNA